MHEPRNRQEHLWLLAGTGEGPGLASALLARGFRVSVSVVTESAAVAYRALPVSNLWIGPLMGPHAIRARIQGFAVDRLIDATHPFATQITVQLLTAATELGCPLVRFERPMEAVENSKVVDRVETIPPGALKDRRWLLALGARHLGAVVPPMRAAGAHLHARILPTPLALRQAVAAGLSDQHVALLRPLSGERMGQVEAALCRHWGVQAVLCRQSGGMTERCWHQVCSGLGLELWLMRRPAPPAALEVVHSVEQLLSRLE